MISHRFSLLAVNSKVTLDRWLKWKVGFYASLDDTFTFVKPFGRPTLTYFVSLGRPSTGEIVVADWCLELPQKL
jgi:hypothetical protein